MNVPWGQQLAASELEIGSSHVICHPQRRLKWFRTISRIKHIERSWSFCDRCFKSSCRLRKAQENYGWKTVPVILWNVTQCVTLNTACLQPVPLLFVEACRWIHQPIRNMKISLLPKCGSISKMFTASYPINPFESTTGVIQMQSKPMPCHKSLKLGSHFTGSCHKKQQESKIPPHLDVVQTIYDPIERAPAVATTSVVDPISRQVTICRVQSLDMKG